MKTSTIWSLWSGLTTFGFNSIWLISSATSAMSSKGGKYASIVLHWKLDEHPKMEASWVQMPFHQFSWWSYKDHNEEDEAFYEGLVNVPSINATIPYPQPKNYEEFVVDHASVYT